MAQPAGGRRVVCRRGFPPGPSGPLPTDTDPSMLRASLAVAVASYLMGNATLLSYAAVGAFCAVTLGLVLGRKNRLWY